MTLYHRTDAAEAILRDGFRDAEGQHLIEEDFTLRGVFLADEPLDCNEGAKGEQLLEVVFPDGTDLSYYEIVEEGAENRYRE